MPATRFLIDELRDEAAEIRKVGGGNPRIHPNGFIQLDLEPVPSSWHASHHVGHSGASRRLHIWNPPGVELPRQETHNEIHDHVFDMWSTVARGALWQVLYELDQGSPLPTHERYRAVYNRNSDSRLESTGEWGALREIERFRIISGKSYRQPAFTLHDSVPQADLCVVTVMIKEKIHEGDAHVICPIDVPPDNSFDRASAAPADLLWKAIENSMRTS